MFIEGGGYFSHYSDIVTRSFRKKIAEISIVFPHWKLFIWDERMSGKFFQLLVNWYAVRMTFSRVIIRAI